MFRLIEEKQPELMSQMFDVIQTDTSSEVNVLPKFIAKKKCVYDLFAWRVSRHLRDS